MADGDKDICDDLAIAAAVTDESLRPIKGGLIGMRTALKKYEKPTEVLLEAYLRGLGADERAMVQVALEEINESYPYMSGYEKKLLAVDTCTYYKTIELKNKLIDDVLLFEDLNGADRNTVESWSRRIEACTKVLDILERKQGVVFKHLERTKEVAQQDNALARIMEDPDIIEIKLDVRRRSRQSVENDSVVDADYRVVNEDE